MPLLLLFVLFVCVPLLELYVIIQVGEAIGILPTIALLLLDSILGTMLMRSQGRAAWRRFNEALSAGRPPAREVLDGALVIFGGAFLLAPGFITDGFGLLLLLPPTRALIRRFLVGVLGKRVLGGPIAFGFSAARRTQRRRNGARPRPGHDDVVDGSATEIDDDRPRLP